MDSPQSVHSLARARRFEAEHRGLAKTEDFDRGRESRRFGHFVKGRLHDDVRGHHRWLELNRAGRGDHYAAGGPFL